MIDNIYIPININIFIQELKSKGIPDATIECIDWEKCVHEEYCRYKDTRKNNNKLCLTKMQNKNRNFCSMHKNKKFNNEIDNIMDDIENNFKKIFISDDFNDSDNISESNYSIYTNNIFDEKTINTFTSIEEANQNIHLNDKKINQMHINLSKLLIDVEHYQKNETTIDVVCKSIINYSNILYENDDEPHICISFLLQFLEDFYEVCNDFFDNIINKYDNIDEFINICFKWKIKINDIIKDSYIIPEEYVCIINKNLFRNFIF